MLATHPEVTMHQTPIVNRDLGITCGKPFSVSTICVLDAGESDLLTIDSNLLSKLWMKGLMTFRLRPQYMQRSVFLAILLSGLMVFSGLLEVTENNELDLLSDDDAKLSSNRSNLLAKVGTNGNDELITLAGANQFNYFIGSDLGAQITFTCKSLLHHLHRTISTSLQWIQQERGNGQ